MIFKSIPVGPIQTNCCLLGDETAGVCCLVDPGDEPKRILAMVASTGLTPQYILLTHGHWDHTGGIDGILEAYPDLPVYIHEKELQTSPETARYQYAGAGANQRTYGEGDTLPLGNLTIRVLHTPGHSLGSVTLLCENMMLAGDTLFEGSCGRCDFYGGSLDTMFRSLKRLAELEGDYEVWSGHGPDTTLEAERRYNPYMKQAMKQ